MHKRAEIKNKVVAMIQASGASFVKVYKSRYLPVNPKNFPAASVYCPEDLSEKAATNEHYNRTAKVAIIIYGIGYDPDESGENTGQRDIDAELDDLASEVEGIFNTPIQTLEGVAYQMNLTRTSYMIDDKTENIIGVAKMEYDVDYKDMLI
jgi:hypothetical protein